MSNHIIFKCTNGEMYGLGDNGYNQLGILFNGCIKSPVRLDFDFECKDIAVGIGHTLFLTTNNEVYVCGDNYWGQLGLPKNVIKQVRPKKLMDNVKLMSCGIDFSLVYTNDKKLYGFGSNAGLNVYGSERIDERFYEPTLLMENVDIMKIVCGGKFTLIYELSGRVWTLGKIMANQKTLEDFSITNDVKQMACGYDNALILTKSGLLYGFGSNYHGKLLLQKEEHFYNLQLLNFKKEIKDMCCGHLYSCILTTDGEVYFYGKLKKSDDPTEIYKNKLLATDIKYMMSGTGHIILIKNNDEIIIFIDAKCNHNGNYVPDDDFDELEIKMDKKMYMINGKMINWIPDYHKNMDKKFKDSVMTFMMIYDRFKKSRCPIGKYVIFDIIGLCF